MSKPRIIIAEEDEAYVSPFQLKFIQEFFDKIDLEIITSHEYFDELFQTPQKAEILVVSEDFYSQDLFKHNIKNIFVLAEHEEETGDLRVNRIYKYTNVKNIFNEIVNTSSRDLKLDSNEKKECQVVLITSSAGGVGKTTIAFGLASVLQKEYKKVLYVNTNQLQTFQALLNNQQTIQGNDIYAQFLHNKSDLYENIKHVIRKELFDYLPPVKTSLMSLGVDPDAYVTFINGAKRSRNYDYIIVDSNQTFDDTKAKLMNIADKVLIITKQDRMSVYATNCLAENINGVKSDKFMFICNDFDETKNNYINVFSSSLKFNVNEYLEHDELCSQKFEDSLNYQKVMYLID